MESVLKRRDFLKAVGLGASSLAVPGCLQAYKTPTKRPNILFFFTDDQRFDTIHLLGNEQIITPNMDRLVQSGMSFTNAYIMGSMAGAVCMPSRSMLMTGRTLFHLEEDIYIIPEEHTQLPETLRKAGYTSYHTGKWHQDAKALTRSFSTGGKVFFGGMSDHYRVPVFDFNHNGIYPSREELRELRREENIKKRKKARHSSELFSDTAIKFLRDYEGEAPFFMYISYTAPHDPRQAPEKYLDMYDIEEIILPKSFMPEHPFDNGEVTRDEKLVPTPRTPNEIRKHIRNYYAVITHLDAQIGRVLAALKETGKFENTIIVFASDNGLAVGRHGLMGKQNLYEHSIKVPLIMSGPGIGKGQKCDAFCYLLDVYPTLCNLTGVCIPRSVEGKSLAFAIRDQKRKVRDILFFAYRDVQRGVRDERYKLIEYVVKGKSTTQLFDLQADPWELDNLADNPAYAGHLKRLRKELLLRKEELGDSSEFWQDYDCGS